MKNFYAPNSRVKLMLFKATATDSLPKLKQLKKEFSASEVVLYKSYGHHWGLINDLTSFSRRISDEAYSHDNYRLIHDGVYVCFDGSATLDLITVMRYSEKVINYYDVVYEDYQAARELVNLLDFVLNGRRSLDSFCASMESFAARLHQESVVDDVQTFEVKKFSKSCETYGVQALETVRERLSAQYEKLLWKPSTYNVKADSGESSNDESLFRDAA